MIIKMKNFTFIVAKSTVKNDDGVFFFANEINNLLVACYTNKNHVNAKDSHLRLL